MALFDNHFMEVNSLGDQQDTPVELLNCLECLNANTNGCTQRKASAHLLISQHTEILPEQCYDNKMRSLVVEHPKQVYSTFKTSFVVEVPAIIPSVCSYVRYNMKVTRTFHCFV